MFLSASHPISEVAGLFLIDPAYEGLFSSNQDMTGENRKSDSSTESQESLTWQEYWNKKMVPHAQGVWLSAVIGFNRLSLMVGLMSPVEDADLLPILPQQVVTRKVWHDKLDIIEYFSAAPLLAEVFTLST